MSIVDVQTIYNHTETIPIFESLADNLQDGNQVFKWMYNNLYGNVSKKDLDFNKILTINFQNGVLLEQLISLVEIEKTLTSVNAKNIMYSIIDGQYLGLSLAEIL